MNHSLETHVHLPASNDLRHIGRVIGLQEGNADALFLEVSLGLRKVKRRMVRRSVPLLNCYSSSQQTVSPIFQYSRKLQPTSWSKT